MRISDWSSDVCSSDLVEAARSRTEVIVGLVRRERLTLRQLLSSLAGARGHFTMAGTPEQVADLIEDWFVTGAADGFTIKPPVLPASLSLFVSDSIPLPPPRGPVRHSLQGPTSCRPVSPVPCPGHLG